MKLLSFSQQNRLEHYRKIFKNNIYIIIDVAAQFKDFKTEEIIDRMIDIYKKQGKKLNISFLKII